MMEARSDRETGTRREKVKKEEKEKETLELEEGSGERGRYGRRRCASPDSGAGPGNIRT